jgi:hypothetical protein
LSIGPQQDANTTATLRTAGAAASHNSERMRNLQVVVSDDGNISVPSGARLAVAVDADKRDESLGATSTSTAYQTAPL